MYRYLLQVIVLSWALLLGKAEASSTLRVVTSTTALAALASEVGGERVEARALAEPNQDPHWVEARPHLALELSKADLLVIVGADLETGWLPTLQVGSRNGKIQRGAPGYLDCSELVTLLERPTTKVERSMGDVHPAGNPHYLWDPRAAERVAVGIAKRLAELDPAGRPGYLARTRKFVASLRQARARWEANLESVRGREVIAFHRSLVYLADWTKLAIVDHVEPKPGIPPNPSHVAELIQRATQRRVRAVLQEVWYPTGASELIAKKINARLVRLSGNPDFSAGQSYQAHMDRVVASLVEAL